MSNCYICNKELPEGYGQVCKYCMEVNPKSPTDTVSLNALKNSLWQIVRNEGIIINNQNIDWLLERAFKEM